MIISFSNNFIFFKSIKTAGTSIEAALNKHSIGKDIFTGSNLKSELLYPGYDMRPFNSWKPDRTLSGEEAYQYLKKHEMLSMWKENRTLNLVKPIYSSPHMTPLMLSQTNMDISSFVTITGIRNPFDMLVSYFWWAFHEESIIFSNQVGAYNKKYFHDIQPQATDTTKVLQHKMEQFFNLPAVFKSHGRPSDGGISVLDYISKWQNEFVEYDHTFIIKFESLKKDYEYISKALGLKSFTLPRFKNKQKKINIPYHEYYSSNLKKKVEEKNKNILEKFNYSF